MLDQKRVKWLISLLMAQEEDDDTPPTPQELQAIEIDKLHTLKELREMCRQRGLPTRGDKKKLAAKLIKAERRAGGEQGMDSPTR